jgi:hypothetical protein
MERRLKHCAITKLLLWAAAIPPISGKVSLRHRHVNEKRFNDRSAMPAEW